MVATISDFLVHVFFRRRWAIKNALTATGRSVSRVLTREHVFGILGLAAALVVFRGRAWYQPLADPTIGLYLHIANVWLHGHLPYTVAWDYRPPGLFAIYAVFLAAFGPALAWNVLTTTALVATGIAVGLLARELDPQHAASTGWWAAAFFVILAPENDGVAGAAEIEISAFIAWALYWALRRGRFTWPQAATVGLLCGLALQCKLSALPLLLLCILVVLQRESDSLVKWIIDLCWFTAGAAAPVAVEFLVYAAHGAVRDLVDANIGASVRHMSFTRGGAL